MSNSVDLPQLLYDSVDFSRKFFQTTDLILNQNIMNGSYKSRMNQESQSV